MKIAVIGGSEFALGFRLAGIRAIVEVSGDAFEQMDSLIREEDVGVVVTDEATMSKLDEHYRFKIENLAKPVVITLSAEAGVEAKLREMITRAIGVDLWKD